MATPAPPPAVTFEPGERAMGEWFVPWEKVGVESRTRFLLTDRRLVVQCVFTKAGWLAGKKQREMVNLGRWQELLNAKLEDLPEPTTGSQSAGIGSITDLVIGGRPVLIVNEYNQGIVTAMLPQISHQRAARIQSLKETSAASVPLVTREVTTVVKIPCRFCGTLNENTATRCSSCNAPTR